MLVDLDPPLYEAIEKSCHAKEVPERNLRTGCYDTMTNSSSVCNN